MTGGSPQVPAEPPEGMLHVSPVQHWVEAVHVVPVATHDTGGVPQVPARLPDGTLQASPSQHGVDSVHDAPVVTHDRGGGGGWTATQVPEIAPGAKLQAPPMQQSPFDVQTSDTCWQVGPVGAGALQRRTPLPSGKHGVPPQHSDENEHWLPAEMQQGAWPVYPVLQSCGFAAGTPKQRNTPTESALQQLNLGGGQSQQSCRAFTLSASLPPQMPPDGLQLCGFEQTPIGGSVPGMMLHVMLPEPGPPTGPPQQSVSLRHTLPTTRQPLAT